MKSPANRTSGRSALDTIEDAVHLLRTAPPQVWLAYYLGAIPFALCLLFFWADMSCGAFAARRCPGSALGMVILFIWLKCWQTVFASALRALLAGRPEPKWTFSRIISLVFAQGIVQPSRLFLLPLALIAAFPFAWVVAFYENVTVLGDGTESGVRAVMRRATAQARLWPRENHMLLALLLLLAVVLWLNAIIAVLTVPQLLKMLLGIETAFSRAGMWVILNTTFLAATVTLAWLALDPLVKAIYALRCFRGEARTDGADLLAELSFVRVAVKPLAVVLFLLFSLSPMTAGAPDATNSGPAAAGGTRGREARATLAPDATNFGPAAVQPPGTVAPAQIEAAVKQTLQDDKYAWRLPREKLAEDDSPTKAWFRTLFSSIANTFASWVRAVFHWIGRVLDWLNRHFMPKSKPVADGGAGHFEWAALLRWFAYALLLFAGAALALLIFRLSRQGWRRQRMVMAEVLPAQPDLNDENVTAAQLPEDEWLRLARELLSQGDLRLALRALYLATLAHLAAREIVSIARFKSNRDYENEVSRRARGSPQLREAFSANVSSFDRVWYGLYDVTADAVAQFQSNFDRIRSC